MKGTQDDAPDGVAFQTPVPLQNTWTFWHDKFLGQGSNQQEYEASLQPLVTFGTVQDFWRAYNNMPTVDKLKIRSSFHLFKVGIKPVWEDEQNENGGSWTIRVKKDDSAYVWKELLLAVIGEQFTDILTKGDDICGITVSIRQYDNIIQVWHKDTNADYNAIFAKVKTVLSSTEITKAFYKPNRQHTAFTAPPGAPGASPGAPGAPTGAPAPPPGL